MKTNWHALVGDPYYLAKTIVRSTYDNISGYRFYDQDGCEKKTFREAMRSVLDWLDREKEESEMCIKYRDTRVNAVCVVPTSVVVELEVGVVLGTKEWVVEKDDVVVVKYEGDNKVQVWATDVRFDCLMTEGEVEYYFDIKPELSVPEFGKCIDIP